MKGDVDVSLSGDGKLFIYVGWVCWDVLISRPKGGFRCAYFRESGLPALDYRYSLHMLALGSVGFPAFRNTPLARRRKILALILVSVQ